MRFQHPTMKNIFYLVAFTFLMTYPLTGMAQEAATESTGAGILGWCNTVFHAITSFISGILFREIGGREEVQWDGFPFIVLWLLAAGVYLTLRMGFVNLRLFRHAIAVVRGKYSKDSDPGELTHFQALASAVSGTVGLGNIAGVAIAVAIGGPGAVLWMMAMGFLGMTTKMCEVTVSVKYRKFDEKGQVIGGAFQYLREGLKEITLFGKNLGGLGRVLAFLFAVFTIFGTIGAGNMFQSNQTVAIMTSTYETFHGLDWVISLALAVAVGLVLLGGLKRIAHVAEAIVPLMTLLYITSCVAIIITFADRVPEAFTAIIKGAFGFDAAWGGFLGALIMGLRRACFSNEAGLGTAPIVHAPAKTSEPVRAGVVALLEPFIDTIIICFMTGMVIVVTGVYDNPGFILKNTAECVEQFGTLTSMANVPVECKNIDGSVLTAEAFRSVASWFPYILSFCILLFAYSTMITYSYYTEKAWVYLFGNKTVPLIHFLFCAGTFFGGIADWGTVMDFSDAMLFSMALPNLIGIYLMSPMIKREIDSYIRRLKAGEFTQNP
jgi:AGCS family alanine or glycine:cation symporter